MRYAAARGGRAHDGWERRGILESLMEHWLDQTGLLVKLDRGFKPGVYGVCLEYQALADKIGFTGARRQALDYASRLHGQLAGTAGYTLDAIEDDSRSGGPGRKREPGMPIPKFRADVGGRTLA